MNISIEVINDQGISASAPIDQVNHINYGGGFLFSGAALQRNVVNQTFIDIVNGTDGPTYTLKIKENP